VVEIGAGLGALTLALAETGARVTAIEVDDGLVHALREVLAERPGVELLHADATTLNWARVAPAHARAVLVANLPYNVATPLVADLLDGAPGVARMLVMVQREVGERLVAGPGDEAYGAVSVKVAYWATARLAGDVPRDVFLPVPRVDSVLVEIARRDRPPVDADRDRLMALVRAGFAHRRKMLRRALAGLADAAAFDAAGVAPTARAEELGLDDWARLERASRHTGTP
jgi:16S rRNA (adenine1518-N6/adenine1519-N6)-dimethyltransferase